MSRERFRVIWRMLRFDDKSTRVIRQETVKLAAISEFLSLLAQRFKTAHLPGNSVTVDEQLVRFFGHCNFRVYMPSKPDKYGIKI